VKKYIVELTAAQCEELSHMISTGKASARELTHARILLKADQGPEGPGWSDAQIQEALEISASTVARVRTRCAERGVQAQQLVELGYVESISHESVHQVLLANELKPWIKKQWCIPPQADAEFVFHLEDLLSVYTRPYDPKRPQVCMDASMPVGSTWRKSNCRCWIGNACRNAWPP
jgi:hypothetical protein